jgi:hypothetical protein
VKRPAQAAVVALAIAAGALVTWPIAWSFFAATTFVGDDHLFLAFARLAPNPLVAFVRDQHGGEFYRPLPMLAWWLVGHVAGIGATAPAAWPFATLALALHLGAAVLLSSLLVALGRARAVAWFAGALFVVAPQNLEAAYWYAASTDLFATVFVLASLLALVRGRVGASALLALAAYLSKESALVLPALAYVALGAAVERDQSRTDRRERLERPDGRERPDRPDRLPSPREAGRGKGEGRRLRMLAPHLFLAAVVILARRLVLGGWGGSGDTGASAGARVLQLVSGLVHVGTGAALLPEPLAWGVGVAVLALLGLAAFRAARPPGPLSLSSDRAASAPRPRSGRGRRAEGSEGEGPDPHPAPAVPTSPAERGRGAEQSSLGSNPNEPGARAVAFAPLAFVALALAPLPAAGWIVGARYFYLPAAGLAWAAAEALASRTVAARATVLVVLLAFGATQATARCADISSYVARVSAARRAVAEGARAGARVFHIAGGIKDLDLAVKEDPALGPARDDLLVLADVPASFVLLPAALEARAAFLLATPSLPPSGAYRFGDHRVVGLARRGDDPTLDEVITHFPDVRFIRLRPTPGGHVFGRDVTQEVEDEVKATATGD